MYRTTYVDGRVSEGKVLEYIKRSHFSMMEDDAIIVKNQPRALGIWIMKEDKIQSPIDDNADLDLDYKYNSDTTDAVSKWRFLLDTQVISFITVRPDDVAVISKLGNVLLEGFKVSFRYEDGHLNDTVTIQFPDGTYKDFDIGDGHNSASIMAYYTERDSPKGKIIVNIRFRGPRELTQRYHQKKKDMPILLSPGWTKEIKSCVSGGSGGRLSYAETFEGPIEYNHEIRDRMIDWYDEFAGSITIGEFEEI
jgi:hypothetical protein